MSKKNTKNNIDKPTPGKGDNSDKEKLMKLASEYPEEAIIDISEALMQYEGWKKDNPGGTYDEFLEEQGLKRVELSNGGYAEDYKDLIDAYEKGIDVMNGESLTAYIKRIKAAEKD
ncbi:hypothetical protein OAX35_00110 [Candidatus Pelagibacter ubique]|nr:hypothetical protein [Candidatus Pelagibacter ubique]